MQAKWTPGPWQIGEINTVRVDGSRIKGFPISGQGQAIARVWAGTLDQIVSFGNQEANARLIAAAPELVEALAWIVEFINEHPEWDQSHFRAGGECHAESNWFEDARAALRAAGWEE